MKKILYLLCLLIIGPSLGAASIQNSTTYQSITVVGEVHQPGNFKNDPQWNTLIRAIGEAGGWKDSADLQRLIVKRMNPEPALIKISLIELFEDNKMQDFKLNNGDIVIVPSIISPINLKAQPTSDGNAGKPPGVERKP